MRAIEYIVDNKDNGKTVKEYLKRRGYSTSVITKLKNYDFGIVLNGNRVFVNAILACGDKLNLNIPDEASDIISQKLGFKIAYEDADFLVYDKPAGVVVHPTKIYQLGTLGNDYAYLCESRGELCTFRPVYRIDRNTSGLVLIAKNKLAACVDVHKKYICICHGIIDDAGKFDGAIGLCNGSMIKREVRSDGKSAYTDYKRIANSNIYSLCEVTLGTGRTHQIRVHFSNDGHALVGDSLYGLEKDGLSRHALHCSYISFINPITCRKIELSSHMPYDMSSFIADNNIF